MSIYKIGEKMLSISVIAEIIEQSLGKHGFPDIIEESLDEHGFPNGGGFNCYPGDYSDSTCHKLAVFISLKSAVYARNRYHLSCRKALELIVQHVQGSCARQTRQVLFITDNWDVNAFDDWKDNIREMGRHVQLEAYLLVGGKVSLIKL